MDLLSKRYANPCFFMEGMIQTGRFLSFVEDLFATVQKEEEDKTQWEFFLHKVLDGSFADFKEELRVQKELQTLSKNKIETTVQHSMSILNNFNPEQGG